MNKVDKVILANVLECLARDSKEFGYEDTEINTYREFANKWLDDIISKL